VKILHLELLFPYGRDCSVVDLKKNTIYKKNEKLIKDFLSAMDLCKKYGMKIKNSHINYLVNWTNYFCSGSRGRAMIVTPDGYLTSCLEVVDENDIDIETYKIRQ